MGAVIVLAEDERDLRAVYAACLRAAGHEVCEAADGREAVTLTLARRPDLLILDVWMPVMNGFEVLEQVRADPRVATVKVAMLSNLSDSDTRLECFGAGVVDYWIKGLPLAELCARVADLLADSYAVRSSD